MGSRIPALTDTASGAAAPPQASPPAEKEQRLCNAGELPSDARRREQAFIRAWDRGREARQGVGVGLCVVEGGLGLGVERGVVFRGFVVCVVLVAGGLRPPLLLRPMLLLLPRLLLLGPLFPRLLVRLLSGGCGEKEGGGGKGRARREARRGLQATGPRGGATAVSG